MTQPPTAGTKIANEAGLAAGFGLSGSLLRSAFSVLVTRTLSVEWLGLYAVAESVSRIATEIGKLGLDQALVRYVSRLGALGMLPQRLASLRQALRYGFIAASVIAAVLYWNAESLGAALFGAKHPSLVNMLSVFALLIPVMVLAQILGGALQGMKRLRDRSLAIDLLGPLALCAVFLLLVNVTSPLWTVTLSFVAAQAIALIACWHLLRRALPRDTPVEDSIEPGLLRFSLLLLAITAVGSFIRWGDVLLLGAFTDASQTGLYQFAKRIASVVALLTASVIGVFAPLASEFDAQNRPDQARRYLKVVSRWCFSFAWPSFLFLFLFGSPLLGFLGAEFIPASGELALLALAEVAWALAAGNAVLLTMTGHARVNLVAMVLTLLVNLLANLYLIPRLGSTGAALAMLIAMGLYGVLQTLWVWRIHRIWQLSAAHLKPLLAGLVPAVLGFALRPFVLHWPPLAQLAIAGVLFFGLFLGVLYLLGLDAEDREVLSTLIGRLRRSPGSH